MKNLTTKRTLFFALFVLMGVPYTLHTAKSVYQPIMQLQKGDDAARLPSTKRKLLVHGYCRKYDIPKEVGLFIVYFVYGNPLQYKNKPLPNDLSGQDLSGFDFTGCAFTYTNLTYTDLTNVILTNTICDYQKAFQDNSIKNQLNGDDWYQENLPKDLKSIAEVYPKLNNNAHKAKLLHIACGLSRLPFYKSTEFCVKVEYWSSELLQLKQILDNLYAHKLVCSLEQDLSYDANEFCWRTKYLQDKVSLAMQAPHANFAQYLNDFQQGLMQYKCTSIDKQWGFDYYKKQITKNIEGLQKIYPSIRDKQLQQAACNIAQALSKSYQIQKRTFQHHYLFFQHRLMWFKKSVGVRMKNHIHYNYVSHQ